MKQKYYIKATLDDMKAGYDGYQHKMGITKHPNPDKSVTLCSDGFHMAKSVSHAVNYLWNATEFYLCQPIGKVYAEDDTKIRAGGINILWKIPIEKFPARVKADADWEKADAAWVKAHAAWEKARAARVKAYADWRKAYADWEKADAARVKAYAARRKAYAAIIMEDIIKLYEEHKNESKT